MRQNATIRPATRRDIPDILPVWRHLMDFHRCRNAFFTRAADADEAFTRFLEDNIRKPNWTVLVAEVDGRIVGYTQSAILEYPPVFEHVEYGNIMDLSVLPEHRRAGIGAQLVQATLDWFREKDITRIEVRMLVTNETSMSFWKKMGFDPFLLTCVKQLSTLVQTETDKQESQPST